VNLILREDTISTIKHFQDTQKLAFAVAAVYILEIIDEISIGFEVACDECRVDVHWLSFTRVKLPI
jgi:hypothetical protein